MHNRRNVFCQSTNKLGLKAPLTTAQGPLPPKMVTEDRSQPCPHRSTQQGPCWSCWLHDGCYSTRTAQNNHLFLIEPTLPIPEIPWREQAHQGGMCAMRRHIPTETQSPGPGADSSSQTESLRCDTIRKQAGGLREHSCWTTI